MTDDTGGNVERQRNPDGQIEMWNDMLAVEKERIASRNRAVDAMREGFSRLDAADERQYRFHADKLDRDDKYRHRHLTHRMQLTWIVAGIVVLVVGVVLSMAFWGDESQRGLATALARDAISAGAFLGLGFFLGRRSRS